MRFPDILSLAMKNAFSPKSRVKSALTSASVAIGITSVILITSVGFGGAAFIKTELSKLGIDGISVYLSGDGVLEIETADYIAQRIDGVESAEPLVTAYGAYKFRNESEPAVVLGAGDSVGKTLNLKLLDGRFLSKYDVDFSENAAIIDSDMAQRVYQRVNVTGKKIDITLSRVTEKFTVVGVISPQKNIIDNISGGSVPDIIYIPYTSENRMTGETGADQIAVKCASGSESESVAAQILKLLNRGSEELYKAENISGYMKQLKDISENVAFLITGIASISLAVAGIGVLNTMLSSMRERYREIGIYMSLGASRIDVLQCFLFEAVLVCLIGGIAGTVFGLILSAAAKICLELPVTINVSYVFMSVIISGLFGAVFGIRPAFRASRLEPSDALKED